METFLSYALVYQKTFVVSLPMRDGNSHIETAGKITIVVVSLPMRDGNFLNLAFSPPIPELLAYL